MKYLVVTLLLLFLQDNNRASERTVKEETVVSITSDGWCPYTCLDTEENKGLFHDVTQAAYAEVGFTVDYSTSSWVRAINNVKSGKIDILMTANTEQGKDFILYTGFYVADATAFAVLKDSNIQISKGADLTPYHIGKVEEYDYDETGVWEPYIQNHPNVLNITSSAGENHLLELVNKKRIELAVLNRDVARHYISTDQKLQNIRLIHTDISSDLYVGFHKSERGTRLREKFIEGFKALML